MPNSDFGPDESPPAAGRAALLRSPAVPTFAAVLTALLLMLTIGYLGTSAGHSGVINLSWFVQYRDVLFGGGLPRHLPDMWSGLGGLDFFFYGHVPFFTASMVSLVCSGCSDATAFATGGGIGVALSLLTFYLFARRFTAPPAALAGALAYAVMPYHLGVDWYWRQAAAEAFSYALLPVVARGIDIVLRDRRCAPSLAVGVAVQLATHLPTSVLAAHVFGLTVLAWAIATGSPGRAGAAALRLFGLSATGAMLAAPLWLPGVALLGEVSPELLFSDHFVATKWLVTLPDFTPPDRVTMILVLACFGVSAVPVLAGALLIRRTGTPARLWLIVPVMVASVLMTGLSRPLWEVGLLPKVQFPWRLMVFVEFSGALGAALVAEAWRVRRRGRAMPMLLGAVLAASVAFDVAAMARRGPVLIGGAGIPRIGAAEYLPPRFLNAVMPYLPPGAPLFRIAAVVQDRAPGIAAQGDVRVLSRLARTTIVQPLTEGQTVAHVPVPWWPHWRARDAAGRLEIRPDPAGLMEIAAVPVRPLSGDIVIALPWLRVEKLAAALALLGALMLAAMLVRTRPWRRTGRPS
ncbi:MAG: hypothetical protein B7Z02_09430 [Rhodobacterales bacterium 32-67-9]|nr:MAG: hypothetical protein B7Z02_09430 [Rhodobacterales bacterium 32-67-9]